jgi:hypothetical protein
MFNVAYLENIQHILYMEPVDYHGSMRDVNSWRHCWGRRSVATEMNNFRNKLIIFFRLPRKSYYLQLPNDIACNVLSPRARYSAFTDKVERNCHRFPTGTAIILVSWFYCFYGAILNSYRENLVALRGESCSSSREPGSDSCVQLYEWTHGISKWRLRNSWAWAERDKL